MNENYKIYYINVRSSVRVVEETLKTLLLMHNNDV